MLPTSRLAKLLILLGIWPSLAFCQQRVYVDRGRIMIQRAGEVSALTTTERDFDPWLTEDHQDILFVRAAPDDMFRTSVYKISIKTKKEELLFAGPLRYAGKEIEYIGSPQINMRRDTLYLLSRESVLTGDLVAVSLKTGAEQLITDAVSFDLIRCGPFAGNLLVSKRKQDILGITFYVYWLYSPEGKDLGIAGPSNMDRDSLIADECPSNVASTDPVPGRLPLKNPLQQDTVQLTTEELLRNLRHRVEPEYPADAKAAGVTGVVRVVVHISERGDVSGVNLVSGDPRLVAAAVAAVKTWKFEPIVSNGKAARAVGTVEVRFGD